MVGREVYLNLWRVLSEDKSMVFLAGPRQAGKTTLARQIAATFSNSVYASWDILEDRRRILEDPVFFTGLRRRDDSPPLVILDEIHKYRDWKNYLKGICDRYGEEYRFLVTGSGRLDMYQKGGDSLAGRYLQFHLWPFTLAELAGTNRAFADFLRDPLAITPADDEKRRALWERLETQGGFPEPHLKNGVAAWRRWSATYARQLVREDIRDISGVRGIAEMETLFALLPSRIGSPLSIPSLAEDLKVSYHTVQNWVSLFERFFLVFSIPTWTERISRAIRKERKIYLFDAPRIPEAGARFENMVALEIHRAVNVWNDLGLGGFSIHFLKNKEQQEVDFLIANDRVPILLVEAKFSDEKPSKALLAMQRRLGIPAVQLLRESVGYRRLENEGQPLLVAPAFHWLAGLPFG
jgi:hypothetical protein